jgi:hypothetical protein
MNDPHVVSLRYRLETDNTRSFANPSPLNGEKEPITWRLADGVLTCEMKTHYASPEEARAVVHPFLRGWELDEPLREGGLRAFWFTFEKAEVVDRNPLPPGTPQVIQLSSISSAGAGLQASLHRSQPMYPTPPVRFEVSPDIETLWHRYEGCRQGREPLLAMAYFCLSLLEWRASSRPGRGSARKKIKAEYGIAEDVVSTLGDFTTNLGDEKTARKLSVRNTRREPTTQEATWIDAAIRIIIHRVGEHAADPMAPWPMLRMSDLPPQ